MFSFESKLAAWSVIKASFLINLINSAGLPCLCLVVFLSVLGSGAGLRLKRFTKPEYPRLSTVIRKSAYMMTDIATYLLATLMIYIVLIFILGFIGILFSDNYKFYTFLDVVKVSSNDIWIAIRPSLLTTLGTVAFGAIVSLYLVYSLIPKMERGEGLYDTKKLIKKFNPLDYIDIKKGCFIGLDKKRNPVFVPWPKVRETHISVLGATASGKGIILSLISYQSVLAGESVVFIDPKFDRYSPRILKYAAKKVGKNFHFINLNPDQPPQINPIAGAAAHEIEELLVSGFDLKAAGTDGDFHRGRDEDAAIQASRIAIEKSVRSIPELVKACASIDSITSQENFWRKLLKLADLAPLATNSGLDLDKSIKNGDVIYIVGSVDNERVKMLQKMLVVRITQIIKSQDRFEKHQKVCLVMDEFKHLLSPIALTGLGVIRDFDTHCLLAFQSMGDLNSCPSISREEAEGVVKDNTAIKIIYRIADAKYAEELSLASGKRPVFVEQASKNVDDDGHAQGGWREAHVPIIASDLITNLPMPSDAENQASTGILFGVGIAQLFHVSPILVSGDMPKPHAAEKIEAKDVFQAEEVI